MRSMSGDVGRRVDHVVERVVRVEPVAGELEVLASRVAHLDELVRDAR